MADATTRAAPPAPPAPTEAAIRQLASPESFRRGQEYFEGGAVELLVRRGNDVLAEIQGSKYVVAALLAYRETAGNVEERPDAAQLLHDLNRDQLQAILLSLVERQPEL